MSQGCQIICFLYILHVEIKQVPTIVPHVHLGLMLPEVLNIFVFQFISVSWLWVFDRKFSMRNMPARDIFCKRWREIFHCCISNRCKVSCWFAESILATKQAGVWLECHYLYITVKRICLLVVFKRHCDDIYNLFTYEVMYHLYWLPLLPVFLDLPLAARTTISRSWSKVSNAGSSVCTFCAPGSYSIGGEWVRWWIFSPLDLLCWKDTRPPFLPLTLFNVQASHPALPVCRGPYPTQVCMFFKTRSSWRACMYLKTRTFLPFDNCLFSLKYPCKGL